MPPSRRSFKAADSIKTGSTEGTETPVVVESTTPFIEIYKASHSNVLSHRSVTDVDSKFMSSVFEEMLKLEKTRKNLNNLWAELERAFVVTKDIA